MVKGTRAVGVGVVDEIWNRSRRGCSRCRRSGREKEGMYLLNVSISYACNEAVGHIFKIFS